MPADDTGARPDRADPSRAAEFADAFRNFLTWIHSEDTERDNEVVRLVADHLGRGGAAESVVARDWNPIEHVNLQTALNAWSDEDGRTVVVHGVALPPHYGPFSLQQLLTGDGLPPLRLSAPSYIDRPNGPESTLACLRLAVLLVTDAGGRYVLLVSAPSEHEPSLRVEAAGLAVAVAQSAFARLDALRSQLNVYRGHYLEVSPTPMGVSLSFAPVPSTRREDVVLPDAVLGRAERHALGLAAYRDELRAAGQHLKRGLLLFGPPGTGKTHTTRYLMGQLDGYTRLVLTGHALHAIGSMTELARELQPAAIVLEDVDLVAEDRSFGPGGPVLFELLDAMDGAAADADLLFVLTTNRADLLEPALAARPGRVDIAVEIDRPDADARRRLFLLYGRDVPLQLTDAEVSDVVERTDGVTASFLKELVRRAVLESLRETTPLETVTAGQVARALDDLLDSAQSVTRSLLGVGVDPTELPPAGLGPMPMPTTVHGRMRNIGWTGYGPL